MKITFGEWCDQRGVIPTMAQVDVFTRELIESFYPQDREKGKAMSVEIEELPKEITTLINFLRKKLRRHGFAYGAIYCRKTGFGDVLMIPEDMPEDAKQEMLTDLIAAAVEAKKRFQT